MRRLAGPLLAAPGLFWVQRAFAHELGQHRPDLTWSFDPLILGALAIAAVWYGSGYWRLKREGIDRVLRRREIICYTAGLAVLFVALISPLDPLGEQLFCAHMVQHLLLLMAAPPLLVMGRPPVAFLWAFPGPVRRRIGRAWAAAGLARTTGVLMHPITVWIAFSGSFVFWHVPAAYQWALADETIHTVEHLCFLVTALAFWSIVIAPSGRRTLNYGASLLFVATTAVLSGLPGALMIFAPRPLYPAHAHTAAEWGLTLMQDQQLAGLIMWIPAGLGYVVAIAWLFLLWLQEAERRTMRPLSTSAPIIAIVLTCGLLLSGCDYATDAAANVPATGGDSKRGAELIVKHGCGGCHIIPGIAGANGLVGPPMTKMGRRVFVAGILRNTPENMTAWIKDPQQFVPGNAMPNMNISEQDARDITAYLYTLR